MSGGDGTARRHPGEYRYPAEIATVSAALLYALLPNPLVVGPRFVLPVLELLAFVPIALLSPRRMTREDRVLRRCDLGLLVLIAGANTVALVQLLRALVGGSEKGSSLLLGAGQVWLTNVLVYALAYWQLDRGGPVVRTQAPRDQLPSADFRFPQDEDHDAVGEVARGSSRNSDWTPGFVDYLYVSLTDSSAFSPTDTMPLTPRVKLLMSAESISALAISVLVIARGVSLLG